MKDLLITQLRDATTSRGMFRRSAHQLSHILAMEASLWLPIKTISVTTPLGETAPGMSYQQAPVLLPILRSGLALLPGFMTYFSDAPIGMIGLKRDEKTAIAHRYYLNLPPLHPHDHVIILDPMIATGGSACDALALIKKQGIAEQNILFVAVIGSQPGVAKIKAHFPAVTLIISAVDEQLNAQHYIVPGLGDFGDRYFGTE
jgi:uracil phosphoribosyltransferase